MQVLKDNLTMVQNRMKKQVDEHRTKREFEVAYWVFVRHYPYRKLSLKKQGKNKLSPNFFGPYKII